MNDSRGGTPHMDVRRSSRGLSTYFVLAFAIAWGAILIVLGPSAIASGIALGILLWVDRARGINAR